MPLPTTRTTFTGNNPNTPTRLPLDPMAQSVKTSTIGFPRIGYVEGAD